ncbi:cation:proton antiporter [Streptomyces sp. C10]|uniref:cation:proton antiporter n=1 Tax=Streptomyces sp. C10 TaxID=531941 RepID=UPI0039800BF1
MNDVLLTGTHGAAALVAVLVIGFIGRATARRLRQPEVVGEIVAGLLAGPAAVALLGHGTFDAVLPSDVIDILELGAEGGLVLFLVGLAHKLRPGTQRLPLRASGWVVAGGLLPALLSGVAFACWIVIAEDSGVRGGAPLPAFLLMCGVALSITAVPVLGRILAERGETGTVEGQLSMTAAVVIDTVGWLLLSVAVGLGSGELDGFLQSVVVLGGGAAVALGGRYALRTRSAAALCGRRPGLTAVLLGVVALAVAMTVKELGLTTIFGAVLVGLAVPPDGPWLKVVDSVTRVGRGLIPVFFVVTGVTVFVQDLGPLPWTLIVAGILLAVLGKGGGSYLGTRLAGQPKQTAVSVGILMNTRGLTELIVLKVGYDADILTAPVFVALVVMAVATTAMTGPLLLLTNRKASHEARTPVKTMAQDDSP